MTTSLSKSNRSLGIPINVLHTGGAHSFETLAQHYDVVNETINIHSQTFNLLRVRDANALLEGLSPAAFGADERLPYWAQLWPSSIELARHCLEECSLQRRTVLDLGCGLGLAGIAAATAGADVIFADFESDALLFARYNASRNLPFGIARSGIEFRLLDWRSDEELEPVDMIMGADIVYECRSFVPILNLVRRVLRNDGRAVFTDPDRSTGMTFFALAEKEGFEVDISSRQVKSVEGATTILLGELRPKEQYS